MSAGHEESLSIAEDTIRRQLSLGHYGDIVAGAGDPTRDVRPLEHPKWVLKGGQVVVSPPH